MYAVKTLNGKAQSKCTCSDLAHVVAGLQHLRMQGRGTLPLPARRMQRIMNMTPIKLAMLLSPLAAFGVRSDSNA
jgi:hypothetical protein